MAQPRKGKLPEIFVTNVTGHLAGEEHCGFAPWFKARFWYKKLDDGSFDSAKWNADHASLLQRIVVALTALADGLGITLEGQNKFELEGTYAKLIGKPDIVVMDRAAKVLTVIDGKTGKKKDSHYWQILIYIYALRLWLKLDAEWTVNGEIHYSETDTIVKVSEAELTPESRQKIISAIMRVAGAMPAKVPSPSECKRCNIPGTECPDRVVEASAPAVAVDHF